MLLAGARGTPVRVQRDQCQLAGNFSVRTGDAHLGAERDEHLALCVTGNTSTV